MNCAESTVNFLLGLLFVTFKLQLRAGASCASAALPSIARRLLPPYSQALGAKVVVPNLQKAQGERQLNKSPAPPPPPSY